MSSHPEDVHFIQVLLDPLRSCVDYKPKFGQAAATKKNVQEELNVDGFVKMYGADPLYHWVGLDSPLMYAAHKAAGGMTSIYRQLGIGCERLVRAVLSHKLNLSAQQMAWTYDAADDRGKVKTLTLDARIATDDLADPLDQQRFSQWLVQSAKQVGHPKPKRLQGVIFEVRQGYKSADAKRQNADLNFGNRAHLDDYLPAVMIMSTQMSVPVITRYRTASMLVLIGSVHESTSESTLAFFEEVIGYSLKSFFERNTVTIRKEVAAILHGLLTPS